MRDVLRCNTADVVSPCRYPGVDPAAPGQRSLICIALAAALKNLVAISMALRFPNPAYTRAAVLECLLYVALLSYWCD